MTDLPTNGNFATDRARPLGLANEYGRRSVSKQSTKRWEAQPESTAGKATCNQFVHPVYDGLPYPLRVERRYGRLKHGSVPLFSLTRSLSHPKPPRFTGQGACHAQNGIAHV